MKGTNRREAFLLLTCGLLILALGYLITLERWGIQLWGKGLDYSKFGNWSEAISGIGTTGAVFAALATLYWQRRTQALSESTKSIEAETAVFQWLTSKEVRDESNGLIGRVWDLRVQNSTSAPIYNWKVSFGNDPNHICSAVKRPLIPGENFFNLPFLDNTEQSKAPEPSLTFQSRSGRFWSRSARGFIESTSDESLKCGHAAGVSFALLT
jgi:hypothetical protein